MEADPTTYQQSGAPLITVGAALAPADAFEDETESQPAQVILSHMVGLLQEQERRYSNGEEPPVVVRQLPYSGPPLRYLLTGRQVKFCPTREEAVYQYQTLPEGRYWPVPEYAAILQGGNGAAGVVRARINTTGVAPSAMPATVADKLNLVRRPLRGAAFTEVTYRGIPLEVLTEPLTVQLLAGPGNVALQITLPVVLVLPSHSGSQHELFELQLGLLDFCEAVKVEWVPLWASQFTHRESGYCCAIPVVAPRPPHIALRNLGTSTFHITRESYTELNEIAMARQAVLARRTAAAAAAAGTSDGPSPAQAAADAMQQARHIGAGSSSAATTTIVEGAASGPEAGTTEWIDQWAPVQQQQRQRGRGSRRGRGRSSNSRRQRHTAARTSTSDATDLPVVAADLVTAREGTLTAAETTTGIYAGLEPLPDGLTACLWHDVAATSLPEGDNTCIICMDAFTDELEDGSTRLVTQLHCRHTFCVLCLRQYVTTRTFGWRPLHCPQCRTQV